MEIANQQFEELTANFHSFHVEAFNIFALGDDQLPHLICACTNRDFARAICAMLKIARRSRDLKVVEADITSHCYLVPKILADGLLAMVASAFDEAVWVDGEPSTYESPILELGTQEYEEFTQRFLLEHHTGEGQDDE